MSELPSIHSSRGMSPEETHLVWKVGQPRKNRPLGVVAVEYDEDIGMQDAETQEEVDTITDVLRSARDSGIFPEVEIQVSVESPDISQERVLFVVDTNFALSHMNILVELRNLSAQNGCAFKIIVPSTVLQELDGLKNSTKSEVLNHKERSQSVGALARGAINWLYLNFQRSDPIVVGQKLHEKLDPSLTKDDAILDCCLYFQQKYTDSLVILLSNDKNLCNKALVDSLLTISYREHITASLIMQKVMEEYNTRHPLDNDKMDQDENMLEMEEEMIDIDKPEKDLTAARHEVYKQALSLAKEAIDHKLHEEYGDELALLDYNKSDLRSLETCFRTIRRFAFTGFSEVIGPKRSEVARVFSARTVDPVYVTPPKTTHDTEVFIAFWMHILSGLYKQRDLQLQNDLNKVFAYWKTLT